MRLPCRPQRPWAPAILGLCLTLQQGAVRQQGARRPPPRSLHPARSGSAGPVYLPGIAGAAAALAGRGLGCSQHFLEGVSVSSCRCLS